MATTRAACELSGYSNSSQTFFWFSLSGNGLSSSLMKPSSSLLFVDLVGSWDEKREEKLMDSLRLEFLCWRNEFWCLCRWGLGQGIGGKESLRGSLERRMVQHHFTWFSVVSSSSSRHGQAATAFSWVSRYLRWSEKARNVLIDAEDVFVFLCVLAAATPTTARSRRVFIV